METEDVFVTGSVVVALSRIALLASRGYVRHFGGLLDPGDAVRVTRKLCRKYVALLDHPQQAQRRAHRGEARARMTLWPTADHRLAFVVQVSADGAGPMVEQERLRDTRKVREAIRVGGYELVRTPRREALPAWTWRLPPGRWRAILKDALAMARQDDPSRAQRLIDLELKRPGFRGLILQRRALFRQMERARGGRSPLVIPRRMPYLGRIPHRQVDLVLFARELAVLRALEGQ